MTYTSDSKPLVSLSFIIGIIVFDNPNTLKIFVLSYRDNLEHTQKVWIEFGRPSLEFGKNKKKTQAYKVWILKKYFVQKIHVECLLLEMI